MKSYSDQSLMLRETIIYQTKLHKILFWSPVRHFLVVLTVLIPGGVLYFARLQSQYDEISTQADSISVQLVEATGASIQVPAGSTLPLLGAVVGGLLGLMLLTAFCQLLARSVTYIASNFVLTNKRVLMKYGFLRKNSLELILSKIEGIGVEQGILARLLGYGTIVIMGVGGTKETFPDIAFPLEFRRHVQDQIAMAQH